MKLKLFVLLAVMFVGLCAYPFVRFPYMEGYSIVMKIDVELLDSLTAQAKVSPRLRMNFDLRNSDADMSQRMLNAIEPGSEVPVHRHQKTSEIVVQVGNCRVL